MLNSFLSSSWATSSIFIPSIRILPDFRLYRRYNSLTRLVFPQPEEPTSAIVLFAGIFRLKFLNKSLFFHNQNKYF